MFAPHLIPSGIKKKKASARKRSIKVEKQEKMFKPSSNMKWVLWSIKLSLVESLCWKYG
jgi:hypothetical protein